MLLTLLVAAFLAETTNLFDAQLALSGIHIYMPTYVLAWIALFIASLAEMACVPFDNPETHYELTMIHEGILLEYSSQPPGLLFWSAGDTIQPL